MMSILNSVTVICSQATSEYLNTVLSPCWNSVFIISGKYLFLGRVLVVSSV